MPNDRPLRRWADGHRSRTPVAARSRHPRLNLSRRFAAARRLRQLRGLCLVWLLCLLGRSGMSGGVVTPARAEQPARPITLQQAQVQRLDLRADAAWQVVALPDTWAARGLP